MLEKACLGGSIEAPFPRGPPSDDGGSPARARRPLSLFAEQCVQRDSSSGTRGRGGGPRKVVFRGYRAVNPRPPRFAVPWLPPREVNLETRNHTRLWSCCSSGAPDPAVPPELRPPGSFASQALFHDTSRCMSVSCAQAYTYICKYTRTRTGTHTGHTHTHMHLHVHIRMPTRIRICSYLYHTSGIVRCERCGADKHRDHGILAEARTLPCHRSNRVHR